MKKLLSKILAIVIAVMLVVSAMPVAFAADDDIASGTAGDGIEWALDVNGTLTISGEGEIVVDWYAPPWEEYNDSILNVVVNEGITKIPSIAFCYAENLISVSVPASVTDMDIGSVTIFWDCTALQEINVHPDNTVFTSVDGIVFTKDKTKLCFYPMNKSGKTYTIPDTVTDINREAFAFNRTLQSVIIPDTVTTLENFAFRDSSIKSVTLGSGIKTIPNSCFAYCESLESIVIPDSVEAIESWAFSGCFNLNTVTIGSGVKTIGNRVFSNCYSLSAIHYTGTESDWGEIEISEENEVLNSLPIHYITEDDYKQGFDVSDCTTNGHTGGLYCEECETYVTGNVILATGHDYDENGVCTECKDECNHKHSDLDGICDICGTNSGLPQITVGKTNTAYINSSGDHIFVEFVAKESGGFVLTSDNGDDDSIDPYVYLYDLNSGTNDYDDDGGKGLNFELAFTVTAGNTYRIELGSYSGDVEYNYTLEKYYAFSHQPTSEEPYVEFTWDNAAFQWYTVTEKATPITTENAKIVSHDWGSSSYNSQTGWSGVLDDEYSDCYDFFTIPLKAGESISVELSGDYLDGVGIWDYDQGDGVWCDLTDDNTYTLTADYDGNYTLYSYSETGDVTVKAYVTQYQYNKINGQTGKKLKNPAIGTYYACFADINGTSVVSDVFEYTYFITHQPSSAEPYVELNEDGDATYQWYKLEEKYAEITDQNADPLDYYETGVPSSYDSENGWTGNKSSDGGDVFFNIYLEEGESITVKATGNVSEIYIYNPELFEYTQSATPDEDGMVTLTSVCSTAYILAAVCDADATVRAYGVTTAPTEIEGQTTNTLTNAVIGTSYICEITVDGNTLYTDAFEYDYAITHQPTSQEPYVEVNDDTDVTYQWYSVEVEYAEITDQNADPLDFYGTGVPSSYDSENGWTGNKSSDGGDLFFNIDLKEGQTVDIVVDGDCDQAGIWDWSEGEGDYDTPDADGKVAVTAPYDAEYVVYAWCDADTTLKVYINNSTYTELEGENDAALKTTEKGIYFCKVTYADDSVEISDIIDTFVWPISVDTTGVYNIKSDSDYADRFDADDIAVFDQAGNEVKYYEKIGGYPLVAGQTYIVKLDENNGNINNLSWNLIKKAETIFPDTSANQWYSDAVAYSVGRGLIGGYGATGMFGTADSIQRQDFLVILARLDGVDLENYQSNSQSFIDVPKGAYYEKAILWAADCGITTGYSDGSGRFGVGDKITREQLITFLYRYADYKGLKTSYTAANKAKVENTYIDYKNVTDYAVDPVIWAVTNNVISGKTSTTIVPGGNALRCEVAQIMYNLFLNDVF